MTIYEWYAGLEQLAHHDQYGRLAYDANEEIIRLKERLADLNSYATGIQSQRDILREALLVARLYVHAEYGTGNWQEILERDQKMIAQALGEEA